MTTTLTASDLYKWLSFGLITINRIYGRNDSAAGDLYILLFTNPTPQASDVPSVAPLSCPAGTWFDWEHCPVNLSECYLALSTDANTLVAPSAGQGMELTIEYDTDFPVISGVTTVVGDTTTDVASRQIWNNSSPPKALKNLTLVSNSLDDVYAWIATGNLNDITASKSNYIGPIEVPSGETVNRYFGDGYRPFLISSGVIVQGCAVIFTDTPTYNSAKRTAVEMRVRGVYE